MTEFAPEPPIIEETPSFSLLSPPQTTPVRPFRTFEEGFELGVESARPPLHSTQRVQVQEQGRGEKFTSAPQTPERLILSDELARSLRFRAGSPSQSDLMIRARQARERSREILERSLSQSRQFEPEKTPGTTPSESLAVSQLSDISGTSLPETTFLASETPERGDLPTSIEPTPQRLLRSGSDVSLIGSVGSIQPDLSASSAQDRSDILRGEDESRFQTPRTVSFKPVETEESSQESSTFLPRRLGSLELSSIPNPFTIPSQVETGTFLEEPEEKQAEVDELTKTHAIISSGGPTFQNQRFNSTLLSRIISKHIDPFGHLRTSPEEFGAELENFAIQGVADAESSGNPVAVEGVLNTLAQGLNAGTVEGLGKQASRVVQGIEELVGDLVRTGFGKERFGLVDLGDFAQGVFGRDLSFLDKRSLTGEEIGRSLDQLNRSFVLNPQSRETLERLETNFKEIENPELKRAFLNATAQRIRRVDIRSALADDPRKLRDVFATPGPVTGIEGPFFSEIQRGPASDFSANIRQRVNEFRREMGRGKDVRGDITELFNNLSHVFDAAGIEGFQGESVFGEEVQGSVEDKLNQLVDISNQLNQGTLRYRYIPQSVQGIVRSQSALMQELKDALRTGPDQQKTAIPNPIHTTMFNTITVRRATDQHLELEILPSTPLSTVMKLAQAILLDGGRLVDITGKHRLKITKKTLVGTVVSYFKRMLELAAGSIVRVQYYPSTRGMYVEGPLSIVLMGGSFQGAETERQTRLKMAMAALPLSAYTRFRGPAVGGAISDIAGTVGDIAGTVGKILPFAKVVTGPVKAVSSVVKSIGKLFGF